MGRNTTIIPLAPVGRLIKQQFSLRISKKAVQVLSEHLEGRGTILAKKALEYSEHAGRTTLMDRDVELAAKK